MQGLSERHRKLLTKEGFNEVFERDLSIFDTQKETFEQLRKESLVVFGECRYNDFDSFRKSRYRMLSED